MVLRADEQTFGFEIVQHTLAGLKAIEAGVGAAVCIHARGFIEDIDLRKIVALAGGVIVGIVRRRDFYGASAEFGIGELIENDGNFARDFVAIERSAALG